jgi:hypothetical protein
MNRKFNILLEVVWILTGLLCLYAGIRLALGKGGTPMYVFFLLGIVSFLFAWYRDKERKK